MGYRHQRIKCPQCGRDVAASPTEIVTDSKWRLWRHEPCGVVTVKDRDATLVVPTESVRGYLS